ncbi:MAG: DNA-primase RepB domain-containing protein [Pseudomonadota bacterium]
MIESPVANDQSVSELITKQSLDRQLAALGGHIFEFGIRNEDTGKMMIRTWTREKAISSLRWLRYKNIRGHHIYVRAQGSSGVVLIDDISLGSLATMNDEGVEAACIVETSPLNHQVWVRVSENPIPPGLATAVGETLQVQFGGDPNSKDWRHFGRAAGFTNRKPAYVMENGHYPFVRLKSYTGVVTPLASEILERAQRLLDEKRQREQEAVARTAGSKVRITKDCPVSLAYQEATRYVHQKYGSSIDFSRADYAIAKHLLHMGYARDDIEHEMRSNADIQQRKRGHVVDYVQRTLNAAAGSI